MASTVMHYCLPIVVCALTQQTGIAQLYIYPEMLNLFFAANAAYSDLSIT